MEKLLTTDEAAAAIGHRRSALEKWRVTGEGPKFVKFGYSVRYDPKDLRDWVEARKRRSTSQRAAA